MTQETEQQKKLTLKRNVKDIVFRELFKDKKNLLELYRTLYPEDPDIDAETLEDITITPLFANIQYNDLSFKVDNKRIVLVEAQSSWPSWIIHRTLRYICMIYGAHLDEQLKKDKEVNQDKNDEANQVTIFESFIIYTGSKKLPRKFPVSKYYPSGYKSSNGEFFIEIFCEEDETIIGQYIAFCHIFDEQREKEFKKGTKDAKVVVKETIRICKERNILLDFWNKREVELEMMLLDPNYIEDIFTRLPSEEEELRNRITKLEKDNSLLKEDCNLLKKDNNSLKEDNNLLKEDNNILKEDNDFLRGFIPDLIEELALSGDIPPEKAREIRDEFTHYLLNTRK